MPKSPAAARLLLKALGPLPFLLPLLLCACAAPSITMEALEPAKSQQTARMRKLAVGSFRNDRGGVAAAAVETALAGVSLGEKPYFAMISAQGLREDDNLQQLRRQGRLPEAEGFVFGAVLESGWRDAYTIQQRSVCVAWRENGSCRKMAQRDVRCITRTGSFSFAPKVVNARSGAVVFTEEIAEHKDDTACPGPDGEYPAAGEGLVAEARRNAVERFRNMVAPHFVLVRIPLVLDDDSGIPAPLKKNIESGADFARAGDMKRACSLWLGAGGAHRAGYALPYLSGVCSEYAGDLDEAQRDYERAGRQSPQPVPEINAALARIRKARADLPLLDEQTR